MSLCTDDRLVCRFGCECFAFFREVLLLSTGLCPLRPATHLRCLALGASNHNGCP